MTERDEFAYHEMMTHLALCSVRRASHVLIVGGGDGGVVQQILRHYGNELASITIVEIDPAVVQVASQFFPGAAAAFADPRVTVVHMDAAQFLLQQQPQQHYYQVILLDSSDPVGPAASLFSPDFYESMHHALCPTTGGIVCAQAECCWIHLDLIADLLTCCRRDLFDAAAYASTLVPTYPCGQLGFVVAARRRQGSSNNIRVPVRSVPYHADRLRYYSTAVHTAAFVLPRFVEDVLQNDTAEEAAAMMTRDECCFPRCAIQ